MIAPEDVCIRGEAIIQNSKSTGKFSPRAKSFVALRNCTARGKGIKVFSAFCLRLRAGYVQRIETIRLSSLSDPKKRSPAFQSQHSLPLLRVVETNTGKTPPCMEPSNVTARFAPPHSTISRRSSGAGSVRITS